MIGEVPLNARLLRHSRSDPSSMDSSQGVLQCQPFGPSRPPSDSNSVAGELPALEAEAKDAEEQGKRTCEPTTTIKLHRSSSKGRRRRAIDQEGGEESAESKGGKSKKAKAAGGETRHPAYRGVRKRSWGKWVSEIREPGKKSRIWLGSFPCAEMAARAYDVAALCLKGQSALLNFPQTVQFLPRPSTSSPRDIQAAAAAAAFISDPSCSSSASDRSILSEEASDDNNNNNNNNINLNVNNVCDSRQDEDLLINLPALLANMAEGLLLAPPVFDGTDLVSDELDEESCIPGDLALWHFS